MKPVNRHWTDDDILQHLYEVGSSPEAHLASCGACRQRVEAVRANLDAVRAEPEWADTPFFAAQRRDIYKRIEGRQKKRLSWRIGYALITAAAMLMVVFHLERARTGPVEPPAYQATSDAELYKEIYTLVAQDEPRAGVPMRALFREQNQ